jgi:hypothetical protein
MLVDSEGTIVISGFDIPPRIDRWLVSVKFFLNFEWPTVPGEPIVPGFGMHDIGLLDLASSLEGG